MNFRTILLTITALFLSATLTSFAQNKDYKQASLQLNADSCFNQTLIFLESNDYFIEAVDKASGFIKAKSYTKYKKILSAKVGERTTISLFVTPAGNSTKLSVNIYTEDLNWGGSTQNRVISVEDKGIVADQNVYKNFIADLTKHLQG